MYQFLKEKELIPSCKIHELIYENGEWTYVYALNTPFELTDSNDVDLIIYEYICDLILKKADSVHKDSVNIHLKTLKEYKEYLDTQRKIDLAFREAYLEKNPDSIANSFSIENKSYSNKELNDLGIHYLSSLVENDGNISKFNGI